jgi:GrpB-like predicted nucleotidyltransferase (UPF0157 family)
VTFRILAQSRAHVPRAIFLLVLPLKLSRYDLLWPRLYNEEAPLVVRALAPVVAVEHVGSTSVPGLAGKPTIDIAVGIASLELAEGAKARMERLGYSYGGDLGHPQHVFRKGDRVPWHFLVHAVEHGSPMWNDFLYFCDYLRTHPREAERYAALKASLVAERGDWYHGSDKEAFIPPVLDARPT